MLSSEGFFLRFIFLRERANVHPQGGGAERERERERIPRRRCTVSAESDAGPNAGPDLSNCEIMIWAEIKSQMLNWLSNPDALQHLSFQWVIFILVEDLASMLIATDWSCCWSRGDSSSLLKQDDNEVCRINRLFLAWTISPWHVMLFVSILPTAELSKLESILSNLVIALSSKFM